MGLSSRRFGVRTFWAVSIKKTAMSDSPPTHDSLPLPGRSLLVTACAFLFVLEVQNKPAAPAEIESNSPAPPETVKPAGTFLPPHTSIRDVLACAPCANCCILCLIACLRVPCHQIPPVTASLPRRGSVCPLCENRKAQCLASKESGIRKRKFFWS